MSASVGLHQQARTVNWKRTVESGRTSWTADKTGWNGQFYITKVKGDCYRLWYGLAFVGTFNRLNEAKKHIEDNLDDFLAED
jgi:hypothetical protein